MITALAGTVVVAGPAGPALAADGQSAIVMPGLNLMIARQNDGTSTWTTQTIADGVYGAASVALESNGNTVVAAVYEEAGPDRGTLYYFWQPAGGTTWQRQQVSALAAVVPNQEVSISSQTKTAADPTIDTEIVAQNATGTGSTFYWQQVGNPTWHSEAIPTASGTATMPFVSVDSQNTTVVSYTSSDGFGIARQVYGSTSWETVQDVRPGAVEYDVQAMDEPDGEIVVSGTENGSIGFFFNTTGAVSDWYGQNPGDVTQYAAMAMNTKESDITIAGFNPASQDGFCIATFTVAFGSTSWSENPCATQESAGAIPEDVQIAAQPSGWLAMAANDEDGEVNFYGKSPNSSSWSNEQVPSLGLSNFELPGLAAD
jgi:hypothetical protein